MPPDKEQSDARLEQNITYLGRSEALCGECPCVSACPVYQARTLCRDRSPGMPIQTRVIHRDDQVFFAGQPFSSIYVVRSGAIKTYIVLRNGDIQITGFSGPNELIGLDAINAESYPCSAVTLDTSSVCALNYERLCRMCADSPGMVQQLTRQISRSLTEQQTLSVMLSHKSADQRLATFLLNQSKKQGRLGLSVVEFYLPMPRADIASFLALAVETVSRCFTRLHEAAVLEVERSRIRILDREALASIAEEPIARPAASLNGSAAGSRWPEASLSSQA